MKDQPLYHSLKNFHKWASDRKIIQNAPVASQAFKTIEEVVELREALDRGDNAQTADALGDIFVTAANCLFVLGHTPVFTFALCAEESVRVIGEELQNLPLIQTLYEIIYQASSLTLEQDSKVQNLLAQDLMRRVIHLFRRLPQYPLQEVVDAVWETIKDRKGYLSEDGIFIKDEA